MKKEELQKMRDVIVPRVKDIAEGLSDGVFKAHRIYELTDVNTFEVTGLLVEIYVNKNYHYYDFLLNNWKKELSADELYITCKLNKIAICFKIRKL